MADDEASLPADLPEEKLKPLLEAFADGARKIGLYVEGFAVNVDTTPHPALDGKPRHMLVAQFSLGDQAFTKRVQDPEGEQIDHEFRKIEGQATRDKFDEIRNKYLDPGSGD